MISKLEKFVGTHTHHILAVFYFGISVLDAKVDYDVFTYMWFGLAVANLCIGNVGKNEK